MSSISPPAYTDDTPAEAPLFDFELIGTGLARALVRDSQAAIVIGIHGAWGSGKTTLLNAVRRAVAAQPDRRTVFVDFNAWKYRDREALWRALILQVIASLRVAAGEQDPAPREGYLDEQELTRLEESLYRTLTVRETGPWSVNWRSLIVEAAAIALSALHVGFVADWLRGSSKLFRSLLGRRKKDDEGGLGREDIETLSRVIERTTVEREIAQVRSIEQFLGRFQALMSGAAARGLRVCVLVDDLDRCLPETALEIFEAVKLFLDAPGCGFVVALDRDVIRKGLALRYPDAIAGERTVDPDVYVEKTISISYDLPRLSLADMSKLAIDSALPFALTEAEQGMLGAGLGTNPRRWKRFLNLLLLHRDLGELSSSPGSPSSSPWSDPPQPSRALYLKLLLLAYRYSDVFAAAFEDPGLLIRLQQLSNAYETGKHNGAGSEARESRAVGLRSEGATMWYLQSEESFWRIMAQRPALEQQETTQAMGWLGAPGR
ncbi:MAG TPA: P-loop NTPase fold protein [Solirubrobacteraceae bacterium]|jgi:hypothetical protein|nr:P-loop NTPase fold protein [Solirubrobacteraceae bacterium]